MYIIVTMKEESAFREIYDLYYLPLCRFLNYYTRDISAVEDVVQEVFVRLWEDKDCVEISYLKTYLYHAARNRMLNYLRKEEHHASQLAQWASDKDELKGSADCYDLDEFVAILNRAVETLPDKCRAIFIQHKWHKLSYKEIASLHGISVKTVEGQIGIALKRIRAYVTGHYETLLAAGILFYSFPEK